MGLRRAALAGLLAVLAGAADAAPAVSPPEPHVVPIRPSKIILVGDSTTAVVGGWGPSFCARHVTSFLACINLARGGRSSKSYRAEGSWAVAEAEMRVPGYQQTYVLIQFGHNDQPGKPGRSTDLASEFPQNLRRYVAEARAAGAIPVLLTPLTRRLFTGETLSRDLDPWADAVRQVAQALNVPLVDLNQRSAAVAEAMGPLAATRQAQADASPDAVARALGADVPPPPPAASVETVVRPMPEGAQMAQPRRSFDGTHLGEFGADLTAALVAADLARAVPDLRRMLIP